MSGVKFSALRKQYGTKGWLKLARSDDTIQRDYVRAMCRCYVTLPLKRTLTKDFSPLHMQWDCDMVGQNIYDPELYSRLVEFGFYDLDTILHMLRDVSRRNRRNKGSKETIFTNEHTIRIIGMIVSSPRWSTAGMSVCARSMNRLLRWYLPDLGRLFCRLHLHGFVMLKRFALVALSSDVSHTDLPLRWFNRSIAAAVLLQAACKWGVGCIAAKTLYAGNHVGVRSLMIYLDSVETTCFLMELARLSKINFRITRSPDKTTALLDMVENSASRLQQYGCRAFTIFQLTGLYGDELGYQAALEYVKYGKIPKGYIGSNRSIFWTGQALSVEVATAIRRIEPVGAYQQRRFKMLTIRWAIKN